MTTSTRAMPPSLGTATGLSGWEATTALARLSLKRALRGKALWVALGTALLPAIFAIAHKAKGFEPMSVWKGAFVFSALLFVIVPPILLASAIADEIDDKTSAYLWSRALPRWSVVVGKLLGLTPLVIVAVVLSLLFQWLILGPGEIPAETFLRGAAGLAAGGLACAAIAAMLATLFPRFAVAVAVGWMLIDATVGALDLNLHVIAASFGARAIAGYGDVMTGVISLVAITVIATAVAIRRISRME